MTKALGFRGPGFWVLGYPYTLNPTGFWVLASARRDLRFVFSGRAYKSPPEVTWRLTDTAEPA